MKRGSSYNLGGARFGEQALYISNSRSLHALVNILGIASADVARQVGLSRGRITHYTNALQPVPAERRRELVSMLRDVLEAYEDSINHFMPDGRKGKPRKDGEHLPEMLPVLQAMITVCRKMADADEVELDEGEVA